MAFPLRCAVETNCSSRSDELNGCVATYGNGCLTTSGKPSCNSMQDSNLFGEATGPCTRENGSNNNNNQSTCGTSNSHCSGSHCSITAPQPLKEKEIQQPFYGATPTNSAPTALAGAAVNNRDVISVERVRAAAYVDQEDAGLKAKQAAAGMFHKPSAADPRAGALESEDVSATTTAALRAAALAAPPNFCIRLSSTSSRSSSGNGGNSGKKSSDSGTRTVTNKQLRDHSTYLRTQEAPGSRGTAAAWKCEDDPVAAAAAVEEEKQLLAAAAAEDAARPPPRRLVAMVISHEDHEPWRASVSYEASVCWALGAFSAFVAAGIKVFASVVAL
ncbi:hypothetical protein Efla_003059 [Eimeria flavescens]